MVKSQGRAVEVKRHSAAEFRRGRDPLIRKERE